MKVKITKFAHSCVLVETPEKTALFDPGGWGVGDLNADDLPKLDYLVITHEHADHLDKDFVKSLFNKQKPTVVSNSSIEQILNQHGVGAKFIIKDENIRPFTAPHEVLPFPGMKTPYNSGYHFMNVFSHAGDSHTFDESKNILAIASIAPWGQTGDMVKKVLELKPDYVLPIHDWHYTEEARQWLNQLLKQSFEKEGIKLLDEKSELEL